MSDESSASICVVGLGYVGLPLAVAFAKTGRKVVGYDVSDKRVVELRAGKDSTRELTPATLKSATNLMFSSQPEDVAECSIFVVCVPTPIDEHKTPNLSPLVNASEVVGKHLKAGDLVVYESTVFPGATEEVCAPILERESGLVRVQDFDLGYSPERINPGDGKRTIESIVKITSGSSEKAADRVALLYEAVIDAGVYRAGTIKVAEAAKVIENTQRDLNIALMNELSIIFEKMGLDTSEVLAAASTKWNFLPFTPGLVGGHCIGVDPYYLTYKAASLGYHPEVILAGRRINDGMANIVVGRVVKLLNDCRKPMADSRVLVMGITFKENCPDVRNSLVFSVVAGLAHFEAVVDVYDPVAAHLDMSVVKANRVTYPDVGAYDAVVLAVAHDDFKALGPKKIRAFAKETGVIFDVKSTFGKSDFDARL
jgi:UDP-N-acetyl-D-galactosamine dehydrogenase